MITSALRQALDLAMDKGSTASLRRLIREMCMEDLIALGNDLGGAELVCLSDTVPAGQIPAFTRALKSPARNLLRETALSFFTVEKSLATTQHTHTVQPLVEPVIAIQKTRLPEWQTQIPPTHCRTESSRIYILDGTCLLGSMHMLDLLLPNPPICEPALLVQANDNIDATLRVMRRLGLDEAPLISSSGSFLGVVSRKRMLKTILSQKIKSKTPQRTTKNQPTPISRLFASPRWLPFAGAALAFGMLLGKALTS